MNGKLGIYQRKTLDATPQWILFSRADPNGQTNPAIFTRQAGILHGHVRALIIDNRIDHPADSKPLSE